NATDLDAALEETRKRHENLRAVVLLSDGDWNTGNAPASAATRLRAAQVPVYAVPLGSEEALPDIEVTSLEPPTFSVVGKAVQIPFALRSTLAFDYQVEVTLTLDSGATLKREVVVPAQGQVRDMFFWTPDEVGDVKVSLDVPPHQDELLKENNRAEVAVAIKQESIKVLVVESTPRWEYRYLRNALERDPGVDVRCMLFHPGLSARGGGANYLKQFPQAVEELSEYDVIFLGDVGVGPSQLTAEDCARIRGIVENQASGLIFLPGMSGRQRELLSTELKDLYPVLLDDQNPHGFGTGHKASYLLTEMGTSSLLTKLGDTPEENVAIWTRLPGFQWRSPAYRARAGTDVLAIHQQSRAPILVTKTFGTGKVLFMGTDGAWRWREGVEDQYHYRFWGQVARWMAYQRHMAEGESLRIFYTPDRPTSGNVVTLNATVLDAAGAPLVNGEVAATLVDPQGATTQLKFQSAGDGWGLYQSRFRPETSGDYRLTVHCDTTSSSLETVIPVQGTQREMVGKPARPDVLAEIAAITRGAVIPAERIDSICDVVLQLPPREATVRRKAIWASPWWAGTLIAGLAIFWAGRKMTGAI
ncbi:MAG: hypothetical protein KDA92_21350, partial [Planctomycetales bacterium]|nr:hypothetical protein [Planctomycetales bacterium]